MTDFCNPGVFGTAAAFNKKYQSPILRGRERDATEKESRVGSERSEEMSEIVNNFIIRRTNLLNAKFLPPKLTQIVMCKLTDLQASLYSHFLSSQVASALLRGKRTAALPVLNALQKLCNHPKVQIPHDPA
jgi:DNA repair and recombination RAD54-like protein